MTVAAHLRETQLPPGEVSCQSPNAFIPSGQPTTKPYTYTLIGKPRIHLPHHLTIFKVHYT